jgi:flagellar biosynthesis/type III secretory pathway chaperone
MRFKDIILKHQEICNELYALYLEENKLLQKNQQISDYSILERKKSLLVQLDEN